MILQIAKTFVDNNKAEVALWDIGVTNDGCCPELTDTELAIIEDIAQNGMPDPDEGQELLVFRGEEISADTELDDLLDTIGTRLVPDNTIDVYVY